MKWMLVALALGLVFGTLAAPAMAAAPTSAPKVVTFSLKGTIVAVKDNALVVKVTSASRAIARYEQKGRLTLTLSPATKILRGTKPVTAKDLKPNERVSVAGRYTPGAKPVFQATTITVAAK